VAIVSNGVGRASLELADYLATQGGDELRDTLAEALANRRT
jgi:hypothetical protein